MKSIESPLSHRKNECSGEGTDYFTSRRYNMVWIMRYGTEVLVVLSISIQYGRRTVFGPNQAHFFSYTV
jgi:hypothetical protein